MKKFFRILIIALLAVIGFALVVNPEKYRKVCLEGLNLWAYKVLPALLPFLFITLLFTSLCDLSKISHPFSPVTKFLFGLDGIAAFVQFAGLISGYPTGAKIVADLYENGVINKSQATKIAILSSTSGPTFIIGTVGACFYNDKTIGLIIFTAHALAAFLTAVFYRKYGDNQPIERLIAKKSKIDIFSFAMDSALSMLAVGTLIAVFYVFAEILSDYKITYPLTRLFTLITNNQTLAEGLTSGLFECTRGCFLISQTNGGVPLASAIISFGGLSVLAQSTAFLQKAQVNLKLFYLAKAIQAILSFLICSLLCLLFL